MSQSPSKTPAQLAAAFIAETLDELADLATRHGYHSLADTLSRTGLEAERAASGPPEGLH